MRYQYPFRGKFRVTCPYGKPGGWSAGWHIGTDIVGDNDKTIYPIAEGVVESINAHGSAYGNHVCIKHPDGNVSLYAHLSKVSVKVGQAVTLDTPLGIMGATGNANGAHLHLELHQGAYKYPHGYKPKTAPWLIDVMSWIEDHVEVVEQMPIKHWCQDTADLVVKRFGLDAGYWSRDLDAPLSKAHFLAFMTKVLPTDAELIPQEPQRFKAYDYDYVQTIGNIHHKVRVWEVAPELLWAEAAKTNLDTVQHDYMVNAGYSWWTDAAHHQPYSLSVLVSEGKVLANAVPHEQATGCLIVYNDNSVAVKQIADITAEQGVKFAVGGMTIAPKVLSSEEGFTGQYADVLRETKRVVLGWHPVKQRVIIAGYNKMSAARGRDLLLELGCTEGITLDGGGSALMREAGRDVLETDGRYQFGCIYLDM